MKIQVIGSGCTTCHKLYEIVVDAVKGMGLKEKVEYVPDINKLIEMGVMQSPVIAIDGKPVMTGFTPDMKKIQQVVRDNMAK